MENTLEFPKTIKSSPKSNESNCIKKICKFAFELLHTQKIEEVFVEIKRSFTHLATAAAIVAAAAVAIVVFCLFNRKT